MKKINERAPQEALLDIIFPIGCIIESDPTGLDGAPVLDTAEKVHDWYGIGIWESYANGRVLQGVSGTYAIGTTGGEEKVALTADQNGPHTHRLINTARYGFSNGVNFSGTGDWMGGADYYTAASGNGSPHNNMQPYKVVYRWRRIS